MQVQISATEAKTEKSIHRIIELQRAIKNQTSSAEQIEQMIGSALFAIYTADSKAPMRILNYFHEWKNELFFADKIKRKKKRIELVAHCIKLMEIVAKRPQAVIRDRAREIAATDASLEHGE